MFFSGQWTANWRISWPTCDSKRGHSFQRHRSSERERESVCCGNTLNLKLINFVSSFWSINSNQFIEHLKYEFYVYDLSLTMHTGGAAANHEAQLIAVLEAGQGLIDKYGHRCMYVDLLELILSLFETMGPVYFFHSSFPDSLIDHCNYCIWPSWNIVPRKLNKWIWAKSARRPTIQWVNYIQIFFDSKGRNFSCPYHMVGNYSVIFISSYSLHMRRLVEHVIIGGAEKREANIRVLCLGLMNVSVMQHYDL